MPRMAFMFSGPRETVEAVPGRKFLESFLRSEGRIFAYILTLWPHRADADDLLQEVSLFMWDQFDEQNPPVDFVAWGCRIAYFKILDFRKKLQRSRLIFNQETLERIAAVASERESTLAARQEALTQCIERLPSRDRDLLAQRFEAGATTQATADRVGRSVDAVYKALSRIRDTLFECVNRRLATEARE